MATSRPTAATHKYAHAGAVARGMRVDTMPILPPSLLARLPSQFRAREYLIMQVKAREVEAVERKRKKQREEKRRRVAVLQEHQRKVFREQYSSPDPDSARNWAALDEAVKAERVRKTK